MKNMTWPGKSSGSWVSCHEMTLLHLIHTISTYIRAGAVGAHQSFHLRGLTDGIHKVILVKMCPQSDMQWSVQSQKQHLNQLFTVDPNDND